MAHMKSAREYWMDRVAAWCHASGVTERQLSLKAVRTPNAMRRSRQRACITIKTMEAIEAYMVANPPSPNTWKSNGPASVEIGSVTTYGTDEGGYHEAS